MRYYVSYLHFSDYRPYLCRHVYHNVSAVVLSGLLQVVGISNLTLCFAYRSRLFKFHEPCFMDVSNQLSPPLKVLHCLQRALNSYSLGMSLDQTNAFIHRPYSVKRGIVRCLQLRAKVISGDPGTLVKELVSISSTLKRNNYSGYMATAPQNWVRRIQEKEKVNNSQNTVCLPYAKGLSGKIKKGSAVHITLGQPSKA